MAYVTNNTSKPRQLCQGHVAINFDAGEEKKVDDKDLEVLKLNPLIKAYFSQLMFSESGSKAAPKFDESKEAPKLVQTPKPKAVSKVSKKSKPEKFD